MSRRPLAAAVALVLAGSLAIAVAPGASAALLDAPVLSTASTDGDGDLRLAWGATPGATAYLVQVASDPSFPAASILSSVTTYNRTWIPPTTLVTEENPSLYWRVSAYSSGTSSSSLGDWSEPQQLDLPASQAPALSGPGSPSGGTVVYPAPVSFAWEPVPGAQSYTLQYSSDAAFPAGTSTTTVTTTATSATPASSLVRKSGDDDIVWNWRVRANYYTGASTPVAGPYSSAYHFTVSWPAASSTPQLLSPPTWTPGGPGVSDVKLTWSPVPGASSYRVSVGVSTSDDGSAVTEVPTVSGTTVATTWIPTVALLDQNYFWQVTAYDIAGNPGTPSAVRQFRKVWGAQDLSTTANNVAVTAPVVHEGGTTPATATEIPINDFSLSWDPVARATLYEVQVAPINGDPRLTCRTASTSVTIIAGAFAGTGKPSALVGQAKCLWPLTRGEGVNVDGVYRWRVRAINYSGSAATALQAASPTGTLWTAWSDPEDAGTPERARYVRAVAPVAENTADAVPDTAAWDVQNATAAPGQPSPLFTWSPVARPADFGSAYDVGYEVVVALNADMTNQVSVSYTPSTRLRINGVFEDNQTGLPYYWQVRPFITTDWVNITYIGNGSAAHPSWNKVSTKTDFFPVSPADPTGAMLPPTSSSSDGTALLAWKPQSLTAPRDGGSRGYQVTVTSSAGVPYGSTKVEYPFYVAANPATGKPLPAGKGYKFSVAPLDANGTPGRPSALTSFDVSTPAPTARPARTTSALDVPLSSATLAWSTVATSSRYDVEYWNTATSTVVAVGGTTVKQAAVTVPDLAAGVYGWHVRSVDSAGNTSPWTENQSFTITGTKPVLRTPDAATLPSNDRVLDWEPVPGASRYLVQYASTSGAVATSIAYETRATSLAPATAVTYGTTYYWRVRAVPEKLTTSSTRPILGESLPGTFVPRTVPGQPVSQTPLRAGTGLAFSWTPLSAAASGSDGSLRYAVHYRVKATPENPWTTLPLTSLNTTSLTVSGLSPSTTYQFEVAGVTDEGQGPWSVTREAMTATTPNAPRNLTLTSKLTGLDVRWSVPTGTSTGGVPLTGVVLRYRAVTSSTWTTVILPPTATSYAVTKLAAQVRYRVEVAGANAIGTGEWAAAEQASFGAASAPRSVTATRGDHSAKLSWAAPASTGGTTLQGFVVQMRAYSASTKRWSSWAVRTSPSSSVRTLTVSGLTNGTRYELRVLARTSVGNGTASAAVAVIPAGKPLAPTSVKATATTGKAKITWKKSAANGSTISAYVVQYKTGSGSWKTLKTASASTVSYTWTKARKGKSYQFRVYAKSNIGSSPMSRTVSLTGK